jgi:CRP/FNR family cyclic AMP-dependent transcriptional regulator
MASLAGGWLVTTQSPDREGLKRSGFLSSLAAEDEHALLALGRAVQFHRDATIFSEGDVSGRVVILIGGRVKVSSDLSEGREVVLAIRGPGDLIGELSAIDKRPHSATCTAMEPVEALVIPSETFLDYLVDHPRVAIHLLRMLTSRLRDADRKRIEFGARDTLGRVAARLVELAEQFGTEGDTGVVIDLPFSQQELAGWIGTSRESVVKALSQMRARGWIETGRRVITVRDLPALRARAT